MKKKSIYDILAACFLIFNVDWEEEYELLEVDDIFWENLDLQTNGRITDVSINDSIDMQVS